MLYAEVGRVLIGEYRYRGRVTTQEVLTVMPALPLFIQLDSKKYLGRTKMNDDC